MTDDAAFVLVKFNIFTAMIYMLYVIHHHADSLD